MSETLQTTFQRFVADVQGLEFWFFGVAHFYLAWLALALAAIQAFRKKESMFRLFFWKILWAFQAISFRIDLGHGDGRSLLSASLIALFSLAFFFIFEALVKRFSGYRENKADRQFELIANLAIVFALIDLFLLWPLLFAAT